MQTAPNPVQAESASEVPLTGGLVSHMTSQLQFCILGPVKVVGADGETIAVTSPTQRAILALLLIHRNEVLSADRMIEEIWGDDESRPRPKSLQFHISKLRDALDPARTSGKDGVIKTHPAGYVLDVADDQVDAADFERLVKAAEGTETGDLSEQRAILDDGLSLWRGRVLDGVPELQSARAEAERLGELWLHTMERRIDLDLALGRHDGLVAEIEVLVQQYPLRESLWGQLVLALYRCDRQAEALRAFQQAREQLIQELGIEPSSALRDLETRVLRQDPSLDFTNEEPEAYPNNIPVSISSFVGRESELSSLKRLIAEHRLVTVTGIGGVGKTRHAVQVANDPDVRRHDGTWLVELGGLANPSLVVQAVRSVVDAPLLSGTSVVESLIEHLQTRDALLVLDNCEHVIADAADLAQTLLSTCPHLRMIATSREALRVPGEVSWSVPPLAFPPTGEPFDLDEPPEALSLFAERARAVDVDFALDSDNVQDVVAICRHLDGLPLAIELAAACVSALAVNDIAQRLDDSNPLLAGRVRTGLPHQRTLESTIEWSYDLLTDDERMVFACAGIFAGSFSLDSLETVCGAADINRPDVIGLLTSLVDKSLIGVSHEADTRYRLLETVRVFARTKLTSSSFRDEVERAHSQWAVGFAREANSHVFGAERSTWMGRIADSFDDLRAVLERCQDQSDPVTGLELLTAMEPFLIEVGDHEGFLTTTAVVDGASWLERLVDTGEVPPDALAPMLSTRGFLLMLQGDDLAATQALEQSIELFEVCGDDVGKAPAEHYLATAVWADQQRSHDLLLSAIAAFERSNDPPWQFWMALFYFNLWGLQHGAHGETEPFAQRLARLGTESGDAITNAHASEVFGLRSYFSEDADGARRHLLEAVRRYRQAGFTVTCFGHCLDHVSLWTMNHGDAEQAVLLLGSAEALRRDHVGAPAPAAERVWHDSAKNVARERLGATTFERRFNEGRNLEPEHAGDLATAVLLAVDAEA
jgi:predicted ATPase/DNA-binding SARP family transcriptional activator